MPPRNDRIEITDLGYSTPCWRWLGGQDNHGYGSIGRDGYVKAHRWYYAKHVGPIPDGLVIDHLCRNAICVNPEHLEPVTQGENVLRGVGPFAMKARQTHCIHGHELAGDNLLISRRGTRICHACQIRRSRETNARERAKRIALGLSARQYRALRPKATP